MGGILKLSQYKEEIFSLLLTLNFIIQIGAIILQLLKLKKFQNLQ